MKRNKGSAAHNKVMKDMRKARNKVVRMLARHVTYLNPEIFEARSRKFYFFSL